MRYEIGRRLRKYRERQNLSQKEFAALVGVSNSRVSNWEQGINRPDIDLLAKICHVLDVSPGELLDVQVSPDELTGHERQVIAAYRDRAEVRRAVDILLGIERE